MNFLHEKPLSMAKNNKWPLMVFFFLAIQGFFFVQDYGISWDEPRQREIGQVSYNYVRKINSDLNTFSDRDYGVAVELPMVVVEYALGLKDPGSIYLLRHTLTHLIFLLGAFFLYLLVKRLAQSEMLGIAAVLILVLSPRIYGHSFFNSKDIPFLAVYLITLYWLVRAISVRTIPSFLILAVCLGVLIDIRISGLMMLGVALLGFTLFVLIPHENITRLRKAGLLSMTIIIALMVVYFCWPFLWKDPFGAIQLAFHNMAHFRWNESVLFSGNWFPADNLPRYYAMKWFLISTPPAFLLLGTIGVGVFLFEMIKGLFVTSVWSKNLGYILCFSAFVGPLLAVFVLHSVVYDDWRHLYFVYPPFIVFVIRGVQVILDAINKKMAYGLFSVVLLFQLNYLWAHRGLQHLYFNSFVGHKEEKLKLSYEMDYWGLSYKQLFEYLAQKDKSDEVKVYVMNLPGFFNLSTLPPMERKRFKFVDKDQHPDYVLTNHRWHPTEYSEYKDMKFFSVRTENSTVASLYCLKPKQAK